MMDNDEPKSPDPVRDYLEQRHRSLMMELAALRSLLGLPPLRTQNRRHRKKDDSARADR